MPIVKSSLEKMNHLESGLPLRTRNVLCNKERFCENKMVMVPNSDDTKVDGVTGLEGVWPEIARLVRMWPEICRRWWGI
ncbi:hypothetical protein QVD17_38045 [Tagetes erecta]|uniref:Uncharacterized protein n=1 Tax=Tagetes erecta TaxID=13708 RepID=A0AAD8NKC6_TARER|nr:hypothetical protein QVD17_38045 [Tagetes erecta]